MTHYKKHKKGDYRFRRTMANRPITAALRHEHMTFIEAAVRPESNGGSSVSDHDLFSGARFVFPRTAFVSRAMNAEATHIEVKFRTRDLHIRGTNLAAILEYIDGPMTIFVANGVYSDERDSPEIAHLEVVPSETSVAETEPSAASKPTLEVVLPQSRGSIEVMRFAFALASLRCLAVSLRGTSLVLDFPENCVLIDGVRLTTLARWLVTWEDEIIAQGTALARGKAQPPHISGLALASPTTKYHVDGEGDYYVA
jgi:hypothetical protein